MKSRPPARLVNPAELRDLGEYLERRQEPFTRANCLFFGNNYYKYGFLYKTMKTSGVIIEGVAPSLSEVERFQSRVAESDEDLDDVEADLLEAAKVCSACRPSPLIAYSAHRPISA